MGLAEKQRELIDDFSIIEDPVERFSAIVDRGRQALPVPEADRTDAHLVPGCTSRVWLSGWLDREAEPPSCQFRVEADAPSVQGVAALLCELYSGATPSEVRGVEPECLEALGIDRQLTPTRVRGLGQVRRRIADLAASFEAEGG